MRRFGAAIAFLLVLGTHAFALTPGQRLLLSGCPSTVQIGGFCGSFSANFQTSTYWAQGQGVIPLASWLSVTRASTETSLLPSSPSGFAYQTFGNNVAAITPLGMQSFEARNNYLSNSTAPATQTTGSLPTGTYTLWVNGSGSVQMSPGTGVGCGTGTATNGTPVNFTITVAGTCIVTAVGSLNAANLENGAFGTPFIPCVSAPCSRAADVPQLIGPAATAALNAKAAFFQTSGVGGGTQPRFIDFDTDARAMFWNSSTQPRIFNGAASAIATLGSGTYAGVTKSAFGFDAASITAIGNAGTKATNAVAWGASTTSYLGNDSAGIRALNGYMQRFALSPIKGAFDGSTAP